MSQRSLKSCTAPVLPEQSSQGLIDLWSADEVFKCLRGDDIATLRRQLVIFGDEPREGRRWTFHCYGPHGFAQLPALEVLG